MRRPILAVLRLRLPGGLPVDPYGDVAWTCSDGTNGRSDSWTSVSQFVNYAANTNDMQNYPAGLYGYPAFALTWISGWNM